MPEDILQNEENSFSKKKVGKVVAKKTTKNIKNPLEKKLVSESAVTEIPKTKKPPMRPTTKVKKNSSKDKELNDRLTSIYSDTNGKIPNMREIKVKKNHPIIRGFFTLLIVGGLMALTAWAGFFYLPGNKNKSDKQLTMTIDGPTITDIGVTTTYKISFKNQDDLILKNAVISINYPESFIFSESSIPANNAGFSEWRMGDIPAKGTGELLITGLNYGTPEKDASWRVFINYTPENFNSEMQEIVTLETKMNRPNVDFTFSGPDKTLIGDDTNYKTNIQTPANLADGVLKVTPKIPDNFTITSSSPKLSKEGYWLVNNENYGDFTFIGRFSDGSEDIALEDAQMGVLIFIPHNNNDYLIAEKYLNTTLAQNKYSASLAINGSMTDLTSHPGEILNITAQFKNTGSGIIKDATIKLNLDSPSLENRSCLNWGEINDEATGDIVGTQLSSNIRRGQIIWSKKQIESLSEIKPGEQVEIDMQIPVQDTDKFDMSSLKEYAIGTTLEINFTDDEGKEKEITGNKINIILNSDLTLETRKRMVTEDGIQKYRITWLTNNTFHPLKNIKITADLFGNTKFITPEEIPAGGITYDEKTKRVTWLITEMPLELESAGLTFDIEVVTPDPTQEVIMSKTTLSADDATTGQSIFLSGEEVKI